MSDRDVLEGCLDADLRILWLTNNYSNVGADVVSERRFKDSLVHK